MPGADAPEGSGPRTGDSMTRPPSQRKTPAPPVAAGSTAPAPASRGHENRRELPPPRVLLCEREPGDGAIFAVLKSVGVHAVQCPDTRVLLEESMRRAPDAVIYDLTVGDDEDIGILELLRRAAPAVPLILVASEGSLMTQKRVQSLRPMYYMVGPVEGAELREAVEAALARRTRGRA